YSSSGATTVTSPCAVMARASTWRPSESMPSSLVTRIRTPPVLPRRPAGRRTAALGGRAPTTRTQVSPVAPSLDRMLYAWGFERVAVVAGDLYFLDPDPSPGQEGAERGVRLEVRLLERPPLTGSIYAAQPIVIDRPVWRADLLESVDGPAGSHDRTHHH